jgi:hypothetical protein
MFQISNRYKRFLELEHSQDQNDVPKLIFWLAILVAYLIANLPIDKLSPYLQNVSLTLEKFLLNLPAKGNPSFDVDFFADNFQNIILNNLIIPIKGFFFFFDIFNSGLSYYKSFS